MANLITGVGYIGAKLASDLLAEGEEVVAVDNLFSTDPAAIDRLAQHRHFHFLRGSYGNPRVLKAAFRTPIDVVYCLAAQASAHASAASPRYTETSNLLAPRLLAEAVRRQGKATIVFASSMHVYGAAAAPGTDEDLPYGKFRDLAHLSKCYAEKLLEMYASLHGTRVVSARLGIVFGISPVMKTDYRFMTAPNKFCLQLVRGERIELYQDANRLNGFVHVDDACKALLRVAEHKGFQEFAPVNVVTEWASVGAVAGIVAKLASERGIIATPPIPERGTDRKVGGRLARTGFQATRSLGEAQGEVLDFFLAKEPPAGLPR